MRNTQTFQSVPSYLIISSIYLCSPSSLSQISAKLRKLHKKNWLTFSSCKLHSTAILFVRLLTFSYESFSVFLNEAKENQDENKGDVHRKTELKQFKKNLQQREKPQRCDVFVCYESVYS